MDEYSRRVLERVFVRGRILARCAGEGIRPWDEYLPHVLKRPHVLGRLFVHGTNTCPMFQRRIRAHDYLPHVFRDEYLPHVSEKVFVHGTNTCLANRARSQRIRIPIRIRIRVGCAKLSFKKLKNVSCKYDRLNGWNCDGQPDELPGHHC